MKQLKRLFFYLFLNVVVSVCATLGVLIIWDQMGGPLPKGLLPRALNRLASTPTVAAPAVSASSVVPQATPTETWVVYQVQSGDTFESIAQEYNISVDELLAVNGFTKSQALGVGEVLRIPEHPKGSVVIDSVIGAGDLASERILLKHRGEGELSLVGWRIEDGQGDIFIFPQFPQLVLFKGGAINIYTKAGGNTVVDLYWGLLKPIWHSGSTVILRDADGNVRATYAVP
jgi:LysM repeat protein